MQNWWNMVKEVLDPEELPLSISRATLQQTRILRVFKKHSFKKCLEMLTETLEKKDDYKQIWVQFDPCLKLSVREDSTNHLKIAELLRWNTFKFGDEQICFKVYIDRMQEGFVCDCDELMPEELIFI
mmetsp:Transcript_12514/g.44305  ORF Transcript_12514/g.44305 Transcript_12514/m.44305 type:complete len:127 (+) Transcript_12514:864-1244(+)